MARSAVVKNYNSFLKGLITEADPFTAPENAVESIDNCVITTTEGVKRRLGIDIEANATTNDSVSFTGSGEDIGANIWEWPKAAGTTDTDLVVTRMAGRLTIWKKGTDALSDSELATVFFGTGGIERAAMSATVGKGICVVFTEGLNTFVLSYDIDADDVDYTVAGAGNAFLKVRDFDGVEDGWDIDERPEPQTIAYISSSGSWTAGELITGGTSEVTAYIADDSPSGSSGTLLVSAPTGAFVDGETITGSTSANTATVSGAPTGDVTDQLHDYNLLNQGWTRDKIHTYIADTGLYPSNAQIWFAGKDANNEFSPAELDKIDFGNSPAPKGHFIIGALDTDRAGVSGLSTIVSSSTSSRPAQGAFFAGRLWHGQVASAKHSTTVFFSPIIKNLEEITTASTAVLGHCYQQNDPTTEIGNELLPDDGGTIQVPEMGQLVKMVPLGNALLLIATNGVWAIRGGIESGFKADQYSVDKVSSSGADSAEGDIIGTPESVIVADNSVYYWANEGIVKIEQDSVGKFSYTDITLNTIKTFYKSIPLKYRAGAKAYYDLSDQKIYWTYNEGPTGGIYAHLNVLVFDVRLGAFYPFSIAEVNDGEGPYIVGFTQNTKETGTTIPPALKTLMWQPRVSGSLCIFNFAEFNDTEFKDFASENGTYFSSHVETWPDHLGDPMRVKNAQYVFCYFKRTEDGFTDIGGGVLSPDNESGCLMRGKWAWHNTDAGGRWSTQRQVYRYRKTYVPVDANDDYDTGEDLIVTRNKVRGAGESLALRFDSEDGKDFRLVGISVPYTSTVTP